MPKELWKGNEAIAEAAVRAGLQADFGYPITPQTEILESVQVIVDAADPLSSQAALAAAGGLAQARNLEILGAQARRSTLPLEARVRPRYNPGLRSPVYIVPGLVGVILTITMVLITAMAIVGA